MSRIYEALQTAETTRSKNSAASALGVMDMPEQRQNSRVALAVPLTVYGRTLNGSPFYQEADAVSGNADGGLIVLRVTVVEGQDLLIINNQTSIEQICRVVHVRSRDAETNEVGIAFSSPNEEFWLVPEIPIKWQEKPWDEDF